jgi:hypothetical protein
MIGFENQLYYLIHSLISQDSYVSGVDTAPIKMHNQQTPCPATHKIQHTRRHGVEMIYNYGSLHGHFRADRGRLPTGFL